MHSNSLGLLLWPFGQPDQEDWEQREPAVHQPWITWGVEHLFAPPAPSWATHFPSATGVLCWLPCNHSQCVSPIIRGRAQLSPIIRGRAHSKDTENRNFRLLSHKGETKSKRDPYIKPGSLQNSVLFPITLLLVRLINAYQHLSGKQILGYLCVCFPPSWMVKSIVKIKMDLSFSSVSFRYLMTSFSSSLLWRWCWKWWPWVSLARNATLETPGTAWISSLSWLGRLPAFICIL